VKWKRFKAPVSECEQIRRQIDPDDLVASFLEADGGASRAAADIEHSRRGPREEFVHESALQRSETPLGAV
jgi:hypothetical protein